MMVVYATHFGNQRQVTGGQISMVTVKLWPGVEGIRVAPVDCRKT